MNDLPRAQRWLMLGTDLGFIAYWVLSALHAFPPDQLFKDSDNPILQSWNWSFLPVDLLVSASGLGALVLARRKQAARAASLALISLVLTHTSGLMALSFWVLRADYSLQWWLPNLFLLIYPLPFLARHIAQR
jgi:hypothetical protein